MEPLSNANPDNWSFDEVSMEDGGNEEGYISYRDGSSAQESYFGMNDYEVSPSRQRSNSLLTSLCPYSTAALDISKATTAQPPENVYLDRSMSTILKRYQQISIDHSIPELPLLLDAYTIHLVADSPHQQQINALKEENAELMRQLQAPHSPKYTEELALIVALKQVLEEKDAELDAIKLQLQDLAQENFLLKQEQKTWQKECREQAQLLAKLQEQIASEAQESKKEVPSTFMQFEQNSDTLMDRLEQFTLIQSDLLGWIDSIPKQFTGEVADPLKSSVEALLHSMNLCYEGTNSIMGFLALLLDSVSEEPQGVTMDELYSGFDQYILVSGTLTQHLRTFITKSNAPSPMPLDRQAIRELDEAKNLKEIAVKALAEVENAKKAVEEKQRELAEKEEKVEAAQASVSAMLKAAQIHQLREDVKQDAKQPANYEDCRTPTNEVWSEVEEENSLTFSQKCESYLKDMDVVVDITLRIRDQLLSVYKIEDDVYNALFNLSALEISQIEDPLQQCIDTTSCTLLGIFKLLNAEAAETSNRSHTPSDNDQEEDGQIDMMCMQSLGKNAQLAATIQQTIQQVTGQSGGDGDSGAEVQIPFMLAAKPDTVSGDFNEVTVLQKELDSRNDVIQTMIEQLEEKDKIISSLTQEFVKQSQSQSQIHAHAHISSPEQAHDRTIVKAEIDVIDELIRSHSVERIGQPITTNLGKDIDAALNGLQLAHSANTTAELMKLKFEIRTKLSNVEKIMISLGITDKGSVFSLINNYLSIIEKADGDDDPTFLPQLLQQQSDEINNVTKSRTLDNFVCWTSTESPQNPMSGDIRQALGPRNEQSTGEVAYANINARAGMMHEWHIPVRSDVYTMTDDASGVLTSVSAVDMGNGAEKEKLESEFWAQKQELACLTREIMSVRAELDLANNRAKLAEEKLENSNQTLEQINNAIDTSNTQLAQRDKEIQHLKAALAKYIAQERTKEESNAAVIQSQIESMRQLLETQTTDLKRAASALKAEQQKSAGLEATVADLKLLCSQKDTQMNQLRRQEDEFISRLKEHEECSTLLEKQAAELVEQREKMCEYTRELQRLKLLLLDKDNQVQRIRDINERLTTNIAALKIDLEQQKHVGASQTSDSMLNTSYRLSTQLNDVKLDIQRLQMELSRMDRDNNRPDNQNPATDNGPWEDEFVPREQLIQMLVERDMKIAVLTEEKSAQETPIGSSEMQHSKPKLRSRPQSSKKPMSFNSIQSTSATKPRPVSSNPKIGMTSASHSNLNSTAKKEASMNSLKHQLIASEKTINTLQMELTSANTKLAQAKAAEITLKKLVHEKQKEIETLKLQNTTLTQRLEKCDRKITALESDKCDLMARLVNATNNSDVSPQTRLRKLINSTLNVQEETSAGGDAESAGSEVTQKSGKVGFTPLMHAITVGNSEEIKSNLAYAGYRTTNGTTALMLAVEYNNIPAVKLLARIEARIARTTGETALATALMKGNMTAAKILTDSEGISTNGIDCTGGRKTELMKAAEDNDIVSVWCLLPLQGNLRDQDGCTALMYAARKGHIEVARLLCDKEMRAQSKKGETALMFAAASGCVDVVKLLKDKEWGMYDVNGSTALMLAAQYNRPAVVSLLVDKEARMIAKKLHEFGAGFCALMAASYYGNVECVRILLPKEADLKQPNGKSALAYARSDEIWSTIQHYKKK